MLDPAASTEGAAEVVVADDVFGTEDVVATYGGTDEVGSALVVGASVTTTAVDGGTVELVEVVGVGGAIPDGDVGTVAGAVGAPRST